MPNPNSLALIECEISAFIRTDGQTVISDPEQEYIYFMVSLSSTCYILSDESSIPF